MKAREAALRVLALCRKGMFSEAALDRIITEGKLSPRDSSLCSRIVYTTLVNENLLDFYIGSFCSTPPGRLEPFVLDVLRLSAAQILFLSRIPAWSAVSEGVDLCRRAGVSKAGSLVNAVLRRIAANAGDLPEVPGEGTAGYLSVRYSHPLWLAEKLTAEYGYDFTECFFSANNSEPPVCVQTNVLRTDAASLLSALRKRGFQAEEGSLPGSIRLRGAGRPDGIGEFAEGLFYVQDEAARSVVEFSGITPGMTVLDACAAPGGKSFAAAMLLGGKGEIISCDVSKKKLELIRGGAERLGIDNLRVLAMDGRSPLPELRECADVVIADVPCSGFGVLRKKPEIRRKNPEEIARLPEIQLSLLRGLKTCVKPGGSLIYSTCTVLREENEDVVDAFVREDPEFQKADSVSFWPQINGTDGFYACCIKKSRYKIPASG